MLLLPSYSVAVVPGIASVGSDEQVILVVTDAVHPAQVACSTQGERQ